MSKSFSCAHGPPSFFYQTASEAPTIQGTLGPGMLPSAMMRRTRTSSSLYLEEATEARRSCF